MSYFRFENNGPVFIYIFISLALSALYIPVEILPIVKLQNTHCIQHTALWTLHTFVCTLHTSHWLYQVKYSTHICDLQPH